MKIAVSDKVEFIDVFIDGAVFVPIGATGTVSVVKYTDVIIRLDKPTSNGATHVDVPIRILKLLSMNPHIPGAKLDQDKRRPALVIEGFARALESVADIGTFGAKKYTDNGWMSVPDGRSRYTNAMYRHLLAEARGERLDSDSGLLHAAHAAWNALARLELMLREETNVAVVPEQRQTGCDTSEVKRT